MGAIISPRVLGEGFSARSWLEGNGNIMGGEATAQINILLALAPASREQKDRLRHATG